MPCELTPSRRVKASKGLGREEGDAAEETSSLILVQNVYRSLALDVWFLGHDLRMIMEGLGCGLYQRVRGAAKPGVMRGLTLDLNRWPHHGVRQVFSIRNSR
jgi:hypothetical protein